MASASSTPAAAAAAAAAAASVVARPTSHIACLVRDGCIIHAGPVFVGADPTSALKWCDVNRHSVPPTKPDGVWSVFALTAVAPLPRLAYVRAFLLPAEGAPVELMIPMAGADDSGLSVIEKVVGGNVERGMEGQGEFGYVSGYFNDRDHASNQPVNTNIPHALGIYCGPVVIACESFDGDPQSIPSEVEPAQWLSLFRGSEKTKMKKKEREDASNSRRRE